MVCLGVCLGVCFPVARVKMKRKNTRGLRVAGTSEEALCQKSKKTRGGGRKHERLSRGPDAKGREGGRRRKACSASYETPRCSEVASQPAAAQAPHGRERGGWGAVVQPQKFAAPVQQPYVIGLTLLFGAQAPVDIRVCWKNRDPLGPLQCFLLGTGTCTQ